MGFDWELFENFGEVVYVTDIDTNELVFLNRIGRLLYGIQDAEDRFAFQGGLCYEILQKNAAVCAYCNNDQLLEGQFIKWKCYNPILERYMMLHATLLVRDGRRYRVEFAIVSDSGVPLHGSAVVSENLESLEKRVNDAIAAALQKPTPDETISCIVEAIGKILKSDRVYIFEKNAAGNMDNTYEWVASGVKRELNNLQDVPSGIFSEWNKQFQRNQLVVITDIKEEEEDSIVREYLLPQKVHSLVAVPFSLHLHENRPESDLDIDGFFGADNPPEEYLEQAKTLLRIVGNFILAALKRRNLVRKLQEQSFLDQQTRFGNRYAMNQDFDTITSCDSLGVIYCDVNGLKEINDTRGHHEGDALLLRASQCLRRELPGFRLYRVGGDEFLALGFDMDGETMDHLASRIREQSLKDDAILAVGTSVGSAQTTSVEYLVSMAEQRMYEDKSRYYQELRAAEFVD